MDRKINGISAMNKIRGKISSDLEEILRKEIKPVSTIRVILSKPFDNPVAEEDNSTLLSRCAKLDPKARQKVLNLIYNQLYKYDLKIRSIDAILSQYYINYYGEPSDLTSSTQRIGLNKIKKILIRKDSEYEVKLRKLAQVIYQETYGLSVADEFMYMLPDVVDKTKIEEVACFSPDCFWFKVSGVDVKLDKVIIPERNLEPVVDRLSSCAMGFTLNPKNPKISTDSLNFDRVSLTCPPKSRYYEFNIRRHYPNTITTEYLLSIGSTTKSIERFRDDIMSCYPRYFFSGDQAAGKSTALRRMAERYPGGTVIGTIESAFELELQKIPHLIVKQLRALNQSHEETLEDSLRYGLSVIVNGEARSGIEVGTTIQAGQRSSKGTLSTGHAPDPWSFIRAFVQLLIRDGVFTNENSALYAVISNIDIIEFPAIDNVGDEASGFRYVSSVWEFPKIKESELDKFEPRLIYKSYKENGEYKLKFENNLSDETIEFFRGRNPSSTEEERLERLRTYNYDVENSK